MPENVLRLTMNEVLQGAVNDLVRQGTLESSVMYEVNTIVQDGKVTVEISLPGRKVTLDKDKK